MKAASIRPLAFSALPATRALAEISPQPFPESTPPPERPSKEALLASIPSPKSLVTHLDQFVIGQNIAKRRLALGVSNHFKRLVDAWDKDAPDPIVTDADLRDVVVEKSNIRDFLTLAAEPGGPGGQFAPQRRRVARQQPKRNT